MNRKWFWTVQIIFWVAFTALNVTSGRFWWAAFNVAMLAMAVLGWARTRSRT